MQSRFIEKWERQRVRGRLVYAVIHAVIIGGFMAMLALGLPLLGFDRPDNLTTQTIAFFAIGGFAYGLIRFNIRERFYRSMKGHEHD